MLGAERNQRIRRHLLEQGSVRVSEEARRFGVSEETIRRDIKRLAAEGLADPVFGGAVLRGGTAAPPDLLPVGERRRVEEAAKNAIGAKAAALVRPGESVIIDAGTTTLSVARHLTSHHDLTIATNSLAVAQACADIRDSSIYVIGGRLVPGSLSMIGPQAERDLAGISADWAFIGAAAIDIGSGFTSADPFEAQVKGAMIRAARRTVIVADHTKFGARRFASFARAEDIDGLITTAGCPADALRWLESAGTRVTICEPEFEETA